MIGFLTRLPIGLITDRFSPTKSLSLAFFLCLTSVLGLFFTNSIIILAILFGLLRTGAHIFPMLARAYVLENSRSVYGRLNGWLMLMSNLGQIIGPIILTFFLEISVTGMILTTSVFMAFSIVLLIIFFPKTNFETNISFRSIFRSSKNEIYDLKILIWFFLLAGIFNGIANSLIVPYLSFFFFLSPSVVGIIVGVIQLINIFLILISGELIDKFGVKFAVIIGIIMNGLAGFLIYFTLSNFYLFVFAQILLIGGVSIIMTSSTTQIALTASKKSFASTFGTISGFSFLGTAVAPYFASNLYLINPTLPFLLIGVIAVISLSAAFIGNYKKKIITSF